VPIDTDIRAWHAKWQDVYFSGARIVGEWAYLQAEGGTSLLPNAGIDIRRGVAVRVDDIMRFH
jgi:hypothetical protein